MKRKFSKLVSIVLITVMLTSLITLPAFAAVPVFRDISVNYLHPTTGSKQHRSWMAPYGDELAHFDYYAVNSGGSDPVTYYFGNAEQTSARVDADGIMCINSSFANRTLPQPARVFATTDNGATKVQSGNINYISYSPYIHNFDTDPYCFSDALLLKNEASTDALFENVKLVTDPESNNKYIVEADSSVGYMGYREHMLRNAYKDNGVMNSTVLIADVKLSENEDFYVKFKNDVVLEWACATGTLTDANGTTVTSVEPGWHNIKIMLNGNRKADDNLATPYRATTQRYALFFDEELLTPTRSVISNLETWLPSRAYNIIKFQGSEGLDNFKHYGSSTPHPYGVGLTEAPKSGAIISGTASMHALDYYTNEDTHFEYSYYLSETKDIDGVYTKITSKDITEPVYITSLGKLAINTDLTGYYIKVGARVANRGGFSPEIMSKETYKIEGYADDSGLGAEPEPDENPDDTPDELLPYIIYNAQNTSDERVGSYHGKTALKWGPGDAELREGFRTKFNAAQEDYGFLVIEMYSAKKTYHPLNVLFYSGQGGYYVKSFCANWEGEWRTVKLPISGGFGDNGGCGGRNSPTWKPYESNQINLSAALHDSGRFYEDTELYVSKMYFEGRAEGQTVANEKGEVILPDYYDESTMTDYASMVKERYPNKAHPRLIMTDEKVANLKEAIENDEFLGRVYAEFKKKADALVGHEPDPPYEVTNGKVTMERNYFETVAKYCGLMYLLTGEDKYAEQVWIEAANMIGSDVLWSAEKTGLDAAHITNGMALLYDWCYDYLNDAQKLAIRNALMRHGYNYAINIRNGGGYMGHRNNVVAANSKGFVTSALAICDEPGYENFCNELINLVVEHLPGNIVHQYLPDGNYAEGIGYWSYATYSMMFMTDAMLSATGTDGGIQDMPGLDKTGYFPLAMRGASLVFNFSDANRNVHQNMSPVYYYLADRYNIPALRAYRTALVEKYLGSTDVTSVPSLEDLIWYDASKPYDADWRSKMPKDYFLDGLVPVLSMRSGGDIDELYIGAKGGNGRIGHIQYDGGTFVLDAGYTDSNGVRRGKRWVHDMGADVYARTRDGKYYYRIRTEGHNCIVFDPESESMGQTIAKNEYDTYCPIVDSGATENEAFGVINLQPSYQEYVNEYKRAYALLNNRSQFIVQDKFSRKEAGELYSYLHIAESDMVVASDSHSITLKQKSQWNYLKIDFITDIPDFEIGITDAIHHLESLRPDPTQDVAYNGYDCSASYNKVYFHAENVKDATITMVLTPFRDGESIVAPDIKPMENWDEYLGNDDYANYGQAVINSIDGDKVNITSSWILSNKKKTIILAAYKNGALTHIKSAPATIFRIGDYTVPGFDPKDYDTIKAFIWDDMTSTLTPVSQAFSKK